ncbi:SDR family oxidoreductase [Ochrobactrum vermis]|uniref:SDR family oxidoreductase n=1 Tax=Ochrobactrum vermis TaxID=1827297 RepID=A0ABU8PKT9_9HYPH|nr:SDR family oxidoreductase [Ochrobactrum vermis]PQZ27026.1 oxidoreductase [Ochrobactrum vermis]
MADCGQKTVLITGATRGLGRELALQYAEDRWRVIACGRHQPDAPYIDGIEFQILDAADPASVAALADRLAMRPLDLVINNAAVRSRIAGLAPLDPDDFMAVIRTNMLGPVLVARALRNSLARGTEPMIANISSRAGSISEGLLDDDDNDYAYRCSKAGLNMATAQLASDLQADGINVIALHPGWVKTDMGGDGAVVNVDNSVRGLRKVIAGAPQNGAFMSYNGDEIRW